MTNHVRLPQLNNDERISVSMHVYLEIGNKIYGLISCVGVCWAVNLSRKSMSKINGAIAMINSTVVMKRLSLAAKEKIMAKNIK